MPVFQELARFHRHLGKFALRLGLVGLIGASLPFGGLGLLAAETFTSAYISEVLAVNPRGLKDEDGDRPGWIEIHNGGQTTVSLAGWFLTDSRLNPTRWRFPNVDIPPDKDLLVFVSGKDRTNNLAPLHANFRLETRWDYLALFGRRTNLVSQFRPPPASRSDVSEANRVWSVRCPGPRRAGTIPPAGRGSRRRSASQNLAATFSNRSRWISPVV